MSATHPRFLPRDALQRLIELLAAQGYRVVGPQVRDGAIVYDEIESAAQLPRGIREEQQPGHYRLRSVGDERMFAWANAPQALKPLVFAPVEPLWKARRGERGFEVEALLPPRLPVAVIGARACDLAGLAMQDKIFMQGTVSDPYYAARREGMFIVAVHCTHSAATCFCASTGDGPRASHSYDLALTELDQGFVAEHRSDAGERLLAALALEAASDEQLACARADVQAAGDAQTRGMPGINLRNLLFANLHHERWQAVAQRCLACGNCTMVCPTCFCHAQSEVPALDGNETLHQRQWDSCFGNGHAYIHGIQLRSEIRHRYRQWLTHKLGSWHEQFGGSGCVGCGRCITWCPVGIDITEEAAALCEGSDASAA